MSVRTYVRFFLLTDACTKGLGANLYAMENDELVATEFFSCPVPQHANTVPIQRSRVRRCSSSGSQGPVPTVSVWVDNEVVKESPRFDAIA